MFVQIRNPVTAAEASTIYTVVEDRGERILIRPFGSQYAGILTPVEAVAASDVEPVVNYHEADDVEIRDDFVYVNGKPVGCVDEHNARSYWEYVCFAQLKRFADSFLSTERK
jgi:hypothetical protein